MSTASRHASYSRTDGAGSFIFEVSVPSSFGAIGTVVVENRYSSEVYISDIKVLPHGGGESSAAVTFSCSSWVTYHAGYNQRIFFPLNKVSPTPSTQETHACFPSIGCRS